ANSSGKHAHAIVGPVELQKSPPIYFGATEDPYITRNEVIEMMPEEDWSPFASRAYFNHQLSVMKKNATNIGAAIGRFDPLRLGFFAIIMSGVLVLVLFWRKTPKPTADHIENEIREVDIRWKIGWLI